MNSNADTLHSKLEENSILRRAEIELTRFFGESDFFIEGHRFGKKLRFSFVFFEFLLAMKSCDVSDLLWLESNFLRSVPKEWRKDLDTEDLGHEEGEIFEQIENRGSLPIYKVSGEIITSAERSKLSAIETLADVTDATNVAAAGAVMDTGNEIIAGTLFCQQE